jgi:hypothetical protein
VPRLNGTNQIPGWGLPKLNERFNAFMRGDTASKLP